MTLPVAILAGGLATRLRPITEKIPKALVEVAGQPFIEHQLALLRTHGYTRVVLCVGYLGEMLEQHLGNGSRFGMSISYVADGPKLLGTGGALRRALPRLGDSFFVLYGDSYLPSEYGSVENAFQLSTKPALMTVLKNNNRWDTSNVVYRDGLIVCYDKRTQSEEMQFIDYGLSALNAQLLEKYEDGAAFDLSEVFSKLASEGELAGFEVTERFYEIGSPTGLAETALYLQGLS
ncbi:MAG: NTP transferase domain-containing protein [Blastocatellia bacterium]|nr:NTP transferase domain-containing protein [Blastocatellia bacterium]